MDCPFLSPSNTDTRATPTPLPCPPLPRRTVPAGRPREPESGRRWLPSGVLYSPALPLSPSPSALMLVAASALLATPRVSPTEPGGAGMHVYVPSTRTHSDRPSLQSASPPTVAGTVLPCMVRGASPEDHPHFAPDKYGSSPHPRYLLWRRGGRDARKGGVAAAPALLHLVPSPGPSPSRLAHAPATVSPPPPSQCPFFWRLELPLPPRARLKAASVMPARARWYGRGVCCWWPHGRAHYSCGQPQDGRRCHLALWAVGSSSTFCVCGGHSAIRRPAAFWRPHTLCAPLSLLGRCAVPPFSAPDRRAA